MLWERKFLEWSRDGAITWEAWRTEGRRITDREIISGMKQMGMHVIGSKGR